MVRTDLGGGGQSKLGVQVLDKLLDLTNLTSEDVQRWVSRPVALTHARQTNALTYTTLSTTFLYTHQQVGYVSTAQLECVALGSG